MTTMTERSQIFERVRHHLLTQAQRANSPTSLCALYGHGDLKCAVGCLIHPDVYTPNLEDHSEIHMERRENDEGDPDEVVGTLIDPELADALARSGIPTDFLTIEMLGFLQRIHDSHRPSEWSERLNSLKASLKRWSVIT